MKATMFTLEIESLLQVMPQILGFTKKREVRGFFVPLWEKIFFSTSGTPILSSRAAARHFGHKVNISEGKSNLVLTCEIPHENLRDTDLYGPAMDKLTDGYRTFPYDYATDGGSASAENIAHVKKKGGVNIVFNKVVGSLINHSNSLSMEIRLKKWFNGIETCISNLKRGFSLAATERGYYRQRYCGTFWATTSGS